MNDIITKRFLLSRVFALRKNQFAYESLDAPQSIQTDTIVTPTGNKVRRRVVLTAHGCKVATCTMCPLPDEAVSPTVKIELENWMNQIRAALAPEDEVHTLTLFHNGNFFNDREVPPEWRSSIYRYLNKSRVQELVVESLPQYLTQDRLLAAREDLGAVKLVVAIGLQSSDELVRELCISSTCLGDTFERAIKLLHAQGDSAQVFLLFKPPFLSNEESVYDLRQSIEYCHSFGVTPTVCPMKIAEHTVVADLAARGKYQAPDLWDLYDALDGMEPVRVAASLFPKNADALVLDAFDKLNRVGKLPGALSPRQKLVPCVPDKQLIMSRIQDYIKSVSKVE